MEIISGKDMFAVGAAYREAEKDKLVLSSDQAGIVRHARHAAASGVSEVGRSDSIGEALAEAERSGKTASFLEFYRGPLSAEVLDRLITAGTAIPEAS